MLKRQTFRATARDFLMAMIHGTQKRRPSSARRRTASPVELLEDRTLLAATFGEFLDPNPAPGNQFGHSVVPLSTGNVVITSPYDDAGGTDAGAVYLFNGHTGELISTLIGSSPYDHVGRNGVKVLSNGNYVIPSPGWDSGIYRSAGAVTWGSGVHGVNGTVSAENSIVGTGWEDFVGHSIVSLSNGNYIIVSPFWNDERGAITILDGNGESAGVVSSMNSLVGTTPNTNPRGFVSNGDRLGLVGIAYGVIKELNNGNIVVPSSGWNNGRGAVTWIDGSVGLVGEVSPENSLVGTLPGDSVGSNYIHVVGDGNYVVGSSKWKNSDGKSVGAVTWVDGSVGLVGEVLPSNSLTGTQEGDGIGGYITRLSNGHYVVQSHDWDNGTSVDAGAVTWGDGYNGTIGVVSPLNSLVGSRDGDHVGWVTALGSGDYLVRSSSWSYMGREKAGAITLGNGLGGTVGEVSAENSLVSSISNSLLGYAGQVVELTNGNLVVSSPRWFGQKGAATWINRAEGTKGVVSSENSLIGTQSGDWVGSELIALSNGNYVVGSPSWNRSVGAASWGNGDSGTFGEIKADNSLIGTWDDEVGTNLVALDDGNYLAATKHWNRSRGAVTWGDGSSGIIGEIGPENSILGTEAGDDVGANTWALPNGRFAIGAPRWGTNNEGGFAVRDKLGPFDEFTSANSLIGSTEGDYIGLVKQLNNGNLLVSGGVFFDSQWVGSGGVARISINDATGYFQDKVTVTGETAPRDIITDDVNDTFFVAYNFEDNGKVRVGSQIDAVNPVVAGSEAADAFEVGRDGDELFVLKNSVEVFRQAIAGVESLEIWGGAGDDELSIDYTGNIDVPITFDGQEQDMSNGGDTLKITGTGTYTDATFNFDTEHDGTIQLAGQGLVTYTGLEPITSNIDAVNVTLNYSDAAETITLMDAGNGQTSSDSDVAGEIVTFNNPTGTLALNAGDTNANTINIETLASNFPATLDISGGDAGDLVNLNGDISFADSRSLYVSSMTILTEETTPTIETSGNGSINLDATRNIAFHGFTRFITVNGGIHVTANLAGNAAGKFVGVDAKNIYFTTSGAGDIAINGTGGKDGGPFENPADLNMHGVWIEGAVYSTGTGPDAGEISITGVGGDGWGYSYGVALLDSYSGIRSVDGDITISGRSTSPTHVSVGVNINQFPIISTGSGINAATITIDGQGADGASSADGVFIASSNSKVWSVDGDITITGKGGNVREGGTGRGVWLSVSAGGIASTGLGDYAANIMIHGTGGATGAFNPGIEFVGHTNEAEITSVDGSIMITGHGGSNDRPAYAYSSSDGVFLKFNAGVETTNGVINMTGVGPSANSSGVFMDDNGSSLSVIGEGEMKLNATGNGTDSDLFIGELSVIGSEDSTGDFIIQTNSIEGSIGAGVQSTGNLIIQPRTADTEINLGVGAIDQGLQLDDVELAMLADGFNSIMIGDGTGFVNLTSAVFTDPVVIHGVAIVEQGDAVISAPEVTFLGGIDPDYAPYSLSVMGDLTLGPELIFGTRIDNDNAFDPTANMIDVTGSVTIDPTAEFVLYEARLIGEQGTERMLINNDGTDAVIGQFNNLPEGATIPIFSVLYTISYVGGDGNDVVLTQVSDPLYVDSEFDDNDFLHYPGGVTLREAIIFANTFGGGEITFAPELSGKTIELEDGEMVIDSNVMILGLGTDHLTVDAKGASRHFHINAGTTVELSNFSLTGGNGTPIADVYEEGGSIKNEGVLTLRNMWLYQNEAEYGGAISNDSAFAETSLTIIDSTFTYNSSIGSGGAIYNAKPLTIINSTLSANSSRSVGGAIYHTGFATGLITNSTLSGNRANSTGNGGNGGGITVNGSMLTLNNTIVAGNFIGVGTGANDIVGDVTGAFNIIGTPENMRGLTDGINGNIVGNNGIGVLDVDTVIHTPLSGIVIPVHKLVIGGPAINSGSNELAVDENGDPLKTDEIGFDRISGSRVDRGAVEFVERKDVAGWDSTTGYWSFGSVSNEELTQVNGPRWSTTAGWDLHSGDFTGDGVVDYAGRTDAGDWYVIDGLSKTSTYWGRWGSDASQRWNDPAVTGFVDVGDFNGDGKADILGKNWRGEFYVAESNGSGFTTSYYGRIAQTGWVAHRTGDFNGDHITDVISFRENGDRWVSESTGSAFALDHYGKLSSQAVAGWQNFLVGDFNDDGIDDIVQQAASANGQWWMGTANGQENGAFTTSFVNRWNPTAFEEYHVGDFDGDGKDDLLGKTTSNQLWVNRSLGGGQMALKFWGQWSASAQFSTLIGDFTGDQRTDLVGLRHADGGWFLQESLGHQFTGSLFGAWSGLGCDYELV